MITLHQGGPLHIGVNYRLAYGWDFGGSARGLANPDRLALVMKDFRNLAEHGCRILRWFVLNDGREPVSETALQAGLDAARDAGMAVLFVLVDYTFCFRHGRIFKDSAAFDAYFGEVLEPLIATAGAHPAVMGFELMNEPEMAMRRRDGLLGRWSGAGAAEIGRSEQLTFHEMLRRMVVCAEGVHRLTSKQFSIGTMAGRWLPRWQEALDPARDFLTFHYYGDTDERDLETLLERRVAPVAERFAVGLGEFYPNGSRVIVPARTGNPWPGYSQLDFFRAARRYRLQLAMPWVWNPGENDPGQIALAEWDRFRESEA